MQSKRKFWLEVAALMAAALLASMMATPAQAQAKPPAVLGSAPCSPHALPGSPGMPPATSGESQPVAPPANLGERLAQSDGVICPPPAVDPEIKLPTPEAGKMPVIPPPGSPGGDPSIRPK